MYRVQRVSGVLDEMGKTGAKGALGESVEGE